MSRIGKLPIKVPEGISVVIEGNVVKAKKGEIEKKYTFDHVQVVLKDGALYIEGNKADKDFDRWSGLHRSNLNNLIKGLTKDYEVTLEYQGVGYKASVNGNFLVLNLGYSHDIVYVIPEGVKIKIEKPNLIVISGTDKQIIGDIASGLIKFRPTEPYKGKGLKKKGAWVLRKEGKKK